LTWEITEKAEGSSCSFFLDQEGNFEVCSRNLSLKEDANNAFWKAAIAYQVKERMQELNLQGYALQGELVGEGIQGNIYGIKGVDFYLYSIWDTKEGEYLCPEERILLCKELGLKHVPVLAQRASLAGNSIQAVLSFAEGKSMLNPKQEREGVVLKSNESQLHFKAISNKYLLKQKVD
jgi:RNA ligase (TIGR02306 family)